MSWFKRQIGLDWFDLLLHAAVTGALMGFAAMELGEELVPMVLTVSLVVLGFRRHRALRRGSGGEGLTSGEMAAVQFEELEQRLGELDDLRHRVVELEERADFAERLLVQTRERDAIAGGGE